MTVSDFIAELSDEEFLALDKGFIEKHGVEVIGLKELHKSMDLDFDFKATTNEMFQEYSTEVKKNG